MVGAPTTVPYRNGSAESLVIEHTLHVHSGYVSVPLFAAPLLRKKHASIRLRSAHHVQVSAWEGDVLGVRPVLAQDAEDGALRAVVPRAVAAVLANTTLRARYIISRPKSLKRQQRARERGVEVSGSRPKATLSAPSPPDCGRWEELR